VKEQTINKNMVSTIIRSLDDSAVELIDFDNLRNVLQTMQTTCEEREKISSELVFIKNEYRNRIIGMMKAVMACRHRENDAEVLAQLSGDIENIGADELVALYGRVAARFRDSFPTSFKYLTYPARSGNKRDWSEHKI
jgi:hypothetical protein